MISPLSHNNGFTSVNGENVSTSRSSTRPPLLTLPSYDQLNHLPHRGRTLALLVVTTLLLNFDHGAIPAALVDIAAEMKLNFTEQSLLGALVFAGLTVGSPVAGYVLQRFSPKIIMMVAILIETLALWLFSMSRTKGLIYIFRFITGITQSFPIIYVPVWVDEFAPVESQTQWMGYVQIAVAGGAMLGYLVAGIVALFGGSVYLTWRFNFFLQALLFLPCLFGFIITPKKLIDVPLDQYGDYGEFATLSLQRMPSFGPASRRGRRSSVLGAYSFGPRHSLLDAVSAKENHLPRGFFAQLKKLAYSPLFIYITFALCALYFVVTGIQYWVMQYCMAIFHTSRIVVVIFFTFVSSTAPTLGVWFGGWSCDKLGGYKGGSQLISIKLSLCFALISAIMAIASSMVTDIYSFVAALWVCLFAGGSLMPICVGVLMTTVPAYMRSFSSAFSMLIYNMFGYFLAPFLSGVVMDRFGSPDNVQNSSQALIYGWRLVTWWSLFGVGFYIIGFLSAEYKAKYRRPRVGSHRGHSLREVREAHHSPAAREESIAESAGASQLYLSGSSQSEEFTREDVSYEVTRQRISIVGI